MNMIKTSDDNMIQKTCPTCKEIKTIDEFGKDKNRKDGRCYQCKQCKNEKGRMYFKQNQATINEKHRNYYNSNKKTIIRKQLIYYHINKEELKKQRAEYRKTHKKERKKYSINYYQKNRDRLMINHTKYNKSISGKIAMAKTQARRKRSLGYILLNPIFTDCAGHHINTQYVINIPKNIHNSDPHRLSDPKSMIKINKLALDFLINGFV